MKPLNYEVYVQVADGPDDFTWELQFEHEKYHEACQSLMLAEQQGYTAKLYDPYLGHYINTKGEQIK